MTEAQKIAEKWAKQFINRTGTDSVPISTVIQSAITEATTELQARVEELEKLIELHESIQVKCKNCEHQFYPQEAREISLNSVLAPSKSGGEG